MRDPTFVQFQRWTLVTPVYESMIKLTGRCARTRQRDKQLPHPAKTRNIVPSFFSAAFHSQNSHAQILHYLLINHQDVLLSAPRPCLVRMAPCRGHGSNGHHAISFVVSVTGIGSDGRAFRFCPAIRVRPANRTAYFGMRW